MRIANLALCLLAGLFYYGNAMPISSSAADKNDAAVSALASLHAHSRDASTPTLAETLEILQELHDAGQRQRFEAAALKSPLYYVPFNSPSASEQGQEYDIDSRATQPNDASSLASSRWETFARLGKRAQTFVRFGKRAQTFVRLG